MIDRWSKEIDNVTKNFINEFGSLSLIQLNQKPDVDAWSICQIIQHLIITNESYYPWIEALRKGNYKTPFIGRLSFITGLMGKTILKTVQPDRKRKVKTFKIWQPSQSDIPGDIIPKFESHQSDLKNLIVGCNDLMDMVISSPVNKNIVYRLDMAFDIIVAHEQRHFNQAREIIPFLN